VEVDAVADAQDAGLLELLAGGRDDGLGGEPLGRRVRAPGRVL
jgi:hypothetical protein